MEHFSWAVKRLNSEFQVDSSTAAGENDAQGGERKEGAEERLRERSYYNPLGMR